jgi:hypothetical protein
MGNSCGCGSSGAPMDDRQKDLALDAYLKKFHSNKESVPKFDKKDLLLK